MHISFAVTNDVEFKMCTWMRHEVHLSDTLWYSQTAEHCRECSEEFFYYFNYFTYKLWMWWRVLWDLLTKLKSCPHSVLGRLGFWLRYSYNCIYSGCRKCVLEKQMLYISATLGALCWNMHELRNDTRHCLCSLEQWTQQKQSAPPCEPQQAYKRKSMFIYK